MKTYTIATVVKVDPHPWFGRMREGIEKFRRDTGHNTFLLGPPRMDEQLEAKTIQTVLDQGVDALCVVAFFPQSLELVLSKARRVGTVVITHESPQQRNADYDLEAFDNIRYGAHLMDYLADYMGKQGEYAIFLESLMTKSHSEWAGGAIARQKERYPHMSFVTRKIEHKGDKTVTYTKTKELFKSNPDLKGILAFGVSAVPGAALAVETEKFDNRIAIVGNSLVSACEPYLKNGTVKLISFWDPADAGYVMNKLAVMALNAEKVVNGMDLGVSGYHQIKMEGRILYGVAWIDVTKDNMAAYKF
jgi:simple sugar transport system substrate-binding protein